MPRPSLAISVALATVLAAISQGCTDSSASVGADAGAAVFVPFPSDFCNYTSWKTYVEPDAGGDGVIVPPTGTDGGFIHAPGGRIEYINHVPPHGSTEFPVGTIIVKSIPGQQQTFAMAKRGGGYNPNGPDGDPLNWEWFEIAGSGCDINIVWQGATPPSSQAYGGTPQACNQCHSLHASNDFVASSHIVLTEY
jgi:hypothetical protein